MSDALRAFVCWAPNGACGVTKLYNQRLGKMVVREEGSWRFRPPPNTAKRTMLPNEEFALACRAYYEEQGLIVDATNGQFAHCPLPKEMGETGYYLLWEHHQQQGLLQSGDVGRCCFWVGHAKQWLNQCDYWPDNYFDLWDIYDYYTKKHAGVMHTREAELNKRKANSGGKGRSSKEVILRQAVSIKKTLSNLTPLQRSARVHHFFKPIEITFPDGRVGTYPSALLASIALGVSKATIWRWGQSEKKVSRGPHKNLVARYL